MMQSTGKKRQSSMKSDDDSSFHLSCSDIDSNAMRMKHSNCDCDENKNLRSF